MVVTVKSEPQSVWQSTTAPEGLVVAKPAWSDREYMLLVRRAIINGAWATIGTGYANDVHNPADKPNMVRLDADQLAGWTWRKPRAGEGLSVAA